MNVLLLSAYDAVSHRRWREGLVAALPAWHWTVLTLPARYFSWRIRGNSLSWAFSERSLLERRYDAVVTTSMTDLSALRGMVPTLGQRPVLVYCHENQFAYPLRDGIGVRVEPAVTSLYSLLCADRVLFNTEFNRTSCLAGARDFLRGMPDAVPGGVIERIERCSGVLPVPLEAHWYAEAPRSRDGRQPFTIVWNHRWEYDKAPERLFAALLKLQQAGVDFRVHVIGQQFRERPAVFAAMKAKLAAHIGAWGTLQPAAAYRALLRESHVVVSTALHDFQGLALLEAVASGCRPLAPQRLAYPGLLPPDCLYPSWPDDAERESTALAAALQGLHAEYRRGHRLAVPDVSALSWARLGKRYAGEIAALVQSGASAAARGRG